MTEEANNQESNQEENNSNENNEGSQSNENQEGNNQESNQENNEGNQEENSNEDSKDDGTLLGKGSKKEGEEGTKDYEPFKAPEGMELDEKLLGEIAPIFKEAGLSQEVVQSLVDKYAVHVQTQTTDALEQQKTAWDTQLTDWKEETKKDHGAGLSEVLSFAAKAIDKFGSPRLREVLDETGLGNHPELVKIFSRIGKAVSEDSFVDPETNSSDSEASIDLKKIYDGAGQNK